MNFLLTLSEATQASENISWSNTVDGYIVNWFNNLGMLGNFALIILSLLLATLFGGIIGYQREINGHAAGFRTHILIALGSAVIMILSIYGISNTGTRDPMRFAAAGVTGIGFLGAGSIIQNGFNIKGLTTAASIRVTMAIGMACGAGYFAIGILTTIITIICLSCFEKFEKKVSKKNSNIMIVVPLDTPVLSKILEVSEKMSITVKDLSSSIVVQNGNSYIRVVFRIACLDSKKIEEYVSVVGDELKPVQIKILH